MRMDWVEEYVELLRRCILHPRAVTEWFHIGPGVHQGDSLSPTLFALFINDLALEVKEMNKGVYLDYIHIPILLYADDVVIVAPSYENCQAMLDVVTS